jgi:alcohol dehydrogenase
LAAVITDAVTHEKYAINDPHLIPRVAVLDPTLTIKLPSHITSTTGMDALTHAVEAYIGHSNTKKTRQMAVSAVKLIHENLIQAYTVPADLKAREAMQIAAYDAGVAFTRAYVGYVHAVAHTLGGMYGVPHGLANAVILPYVLEKFGKRAYLRLAELADVIHLTDEKASKQEKALAFIAWIKGMNQKMGIPPKFVNIIKPKDIPLLAKRAQKEGVPLYPVPRLFSRDYFIEIYYAVQD